jgi:hypothetical protein
VGQLLSRRQRDRCRGVRPRAVSTRRRTRSVAGFPADLVGLLSPTQPPSLRAGPPISLLPHENLMGSAQGTIRKSTRTPSLQCWVTTKRVRHSYGSPAIASHV